MDHTWRSKCLENNIQLGKLGLQLSVRVSWYFIEQQIPEETFSLKSFGVRDHFSFQSPLPPPEGSAHSALCEVPLPSIPLQVSTTRFTSQAYHCVTQMCLCASVPRGRACLGPRGELPGNLCLRQAFNRGTLLNSNQEKESLLLTGIHL